MHARKFGVVLTGISVLFGCAAFVGVVTAAAMWIANTTAEQGTALTASEAQCLEMANELRVVAKARDAGTSIESEKARTRSRIAAGREPWVRKSGDEEFMLMLVEAIYDSRESPMSIRTTAFANCLTMGFGSVEARSYQSL